MGTQQAPLEPMGEQDDRDDGDSDHVVDASPNVDPLDLDSIVSPLEAGAIDQALGNVDALVEQLNAAPLETPLNAATQTPERFVQLDEQTPMLTESDGDRSEYEDHFAQSLAKGDKTRKQANRTPEAEGSTADKLGKKQRKQLQFNQPQPPHNDAPGDARDLATTSSRGDARKDDTTKKNKDPAAGRPAGNSPLPSTSAPVPDKRKGKNAAAPSPPGK
ncbi:unnamed protein product [Calypogeia fissa]